MAQGVCSAHVISFRLTLSILMFHPPSLLLPHGHFETTFLSARSLPDFTRSESAGQAHLRTSGGEFVATWPIPRTPQVTSPKSSRRLLLQTETRRPINDPNYDNISDFSKSTRENPGLFGVSTMSEASVSHVSPGESRDSMHRETVARQRGKKEKVL